MDKRIAIVQSNYIPWKGYFDLINMVDEFILYDDVQYTRRDWRNRNLIRTANGLRWLTIPVGTRGKYNQNICETRIDDKSWAENHWTALKHNYASAPYFKKYTDIFARTYEECGKAEYLSHINLSFLLAICHILKITTRIRYSMEYNIKAVGKTERLIALCKVAGGNYYLSGPAAKIYIKEDIFRQENMTLAYMDYSGYPEYPQLYPGFEHGVTILDLIFNTGPDAPKYMKSFSK